MDYEWIKLPLFEEWDYKYTVTLESTSYTIRLYYSDRIKTWSMDVSYEEGEMLIEGEAVLIYKPATLERIQGLNGYFWLEPIALEDNETFKHPDLLYKYFNFYYIKELE